VGGLSIVDLSVLYELGDLIYHISGAKSAICLLGGGGDWNLFALSDWVYFSAA
jgi:hypothetical protein